MPESDCVMSDSAHGSKHASQNFRPGETTTFKRKATIPHKPTCSKTNYLENVDKQCLKANACCPTPETRSNKRPLSLPQRTRQALQAKQRAGTSQHFLKPLRKCWWARPRNYCMLADYIKENKLKPTTSGHHQYARPNKEPAQSHMF